MKWSEERVSHLAHQVMDALWRNDLADFPDQGRALAATKAILGRIFTVEDEVDSWVRDKLVRQKKIAGSPDWQILYERYFREEMEKRGWR